MNKPRLLEEEMGTDKYSRGMKEGNAGIFSAIYLQNKKPARGKSFGVWPAGRYSRTLREGRRTTL